MRDRLNLSLRLPPSYRPTAPIAWKRLSRAVSIA
jgi:hypothetical protein